MSRTRLSGFNFKSPDSISLGQIKAKSVQTEASTDFSGFPLISWLSKFTAVRDSGSEDYAADCPICGGKNKLGIHKRTGLVHCFRCDEGGHGGRIWHGKATLVWFFSILERCSKEEAARRIGRMAGLLDSPPTQPQRPAETFPENAYKLTDLRKNHPARTYLQGRGVGHLIETSRACVTGRYAYRIILPCHFQKKLVGWEAKSYVKTKPKSLFPRWLATGETIYTTSLWDSSSPSAIVTESILDAETVGINSIGLYGSVLRRGQIPRLLELRKQGTRELIWMLDGDAVKKSLNAITRNTANLFTNRLVRMEPHEDPNSIGREECWRRIEKAQEVQDELDILSLCGDIILG